MGSSYDLSIGEFDGIFSEPNGFNLGYHLQQIFHDSELKREEKTYIDSEINEEETYETIYYETTIHLAKKRLEILGSSYEYFNEHFQKEIQNTYNECLRYFKDRSDEYNKIFKDMTIEKWIMLIKEYYPERYDIPLNYPDYPIEAQLLFSDFYIANNFYMIPNIGFMNILRAIMEFCNEDEKVILDLSDIIGGDTIESYEEIPKVVNEYLIVTEGKTDCEFISKSMETIYPEYSHLYKFFDRSYTASDNGNGLSGGTGELINMIKFAITANVNDKIIFIFDNDSEGISSIKSLEKFKEIIPNNIKIISLPKLDFFSSYPSKSHTGKIEPVDINEKACGIEMYLGKENLKDKNGSFYPIEWGAFKKDISQYQGSINEKNKRIVQDSFRKTLENKNINDPNFNEMRNICDHIFKIFVYLKENNSDYLSNSKI
jgi:HEPN/Toprim N-terminal domain 1